MPMPWPRACQCPDATHPSDNANLGFAPETAIFNQFRGFSSQNSIFQRDQRVW
jgi:hypothetical protein